MKITPIEIRQHTFEKVMRGYKPEDVDAFLVSLSQEWERVSMDVKMLKMQLELAEKELGKLKEVEMTLFRTLKTAEDTSHQITDQANKAAEQYMGESKQKADDLLADARKRSALMIQDAENQSRFLKDNILNDLKSLEHDFKALEKYKENLGVQIRDLAGKAIDSVDRFEKKFARQNLLGKIDEVSTQITDELKQADSVGKPDYEAPAPVAAAPAPEPAPQQSTPATELPPLMERETFVPEAIPATDIPATPAAPAPEPAPLAQADDHTTRQIPTDVEVGQVPQSTVAEVTTPEPQPTEQRPAPVTEPEQPRRGGSFFDQI
ncbi:DivIVA domain-containing protein [Spirosoma rhododendri]|uniref:DivIVA domain-containing protein n=1 Tax=Spirosoma rhododendri TaxID=2728024 RepID=A0A7L5DQZ1_9BACT|nr:DivIVA domain-containing protein [Spirosoma rhododendri]QJD78397.1 DivIVA domain-containing protein [Spirosoma rhododendri]